MSRFSCSVLLTGWQPLLVGRGFTLATDAECFNRFQSRLRSLINLWYSSHAICQSCIHTHSGINIIINLVTIAWLLSDCIACWSPCYWWYCSVHSPHWYRSTTSQAPMQTQLGLWFKSITTISRIPHMQQSSYRTDSIRKHNIQVQ